MKGFLRILKERKSCSSLFCTCLVCSQEELSRACRPNIGGVDEEVEAQPFLQAQASTCRYVFIVRGRAGASLRAPKDAGTKSHALGAVEEVAEGCRAQHAARGGALQDVF